MYFGIGGVMSECTITFFLIHPIQGHRALTGYLYPGAFETPKEYSMICEFEDKVPRLITISENNLAGIMYHYPLPEAKVQTAKAIMQGEAKKFFEE